MSFNSVVLSGNLAKKPEITITSNGLEICNIVVATDVSNKNKQGEWDTKTTFCEATLFGKRALDFVSNCDKGSLVSIIGNLVTNKWVDKATGQERSKLSISVNQITYARSGIDNYNQIGIDNDILVGMPKQEQISTETKDKALRSNPFTPKPIMQFNGQFDYSSKDNKLSISEDLNLSDDLPF